MLRDRPEFIDPLSDMLMLLRPERQGAGAVNFGGDWSVDFPANRGVRCYAVSRGACWITVGEEATPIYLERDDCILLATGEPFQLGSTPEVDCAARCDPALFAQDRVSTVNGGGACVLIGGHFLLDTTHEQLLSSALPPLMITRDPGQRGAVGSLLKGLWAELETPRPGSRLVIAHLTQMMLIFALRLYAESESRRPAGWLSALADPRIAIALTALHAAPEKPWTVGTMASVAGMSRTVFAERFRTLVGTPPLAYLSQWRLLTAASRLRKRTSSVTDVAFAVGYGSSTAFSTAFRRAFGMAPRDYARCHDGSRPALDLGFEAKMAPAGSDIRFEENGSV